jgi:nitroreductase
MNTLEAIAKRKSTRSYKAEQIGEEALAAIIKAGCAAPIALAKYDSLHITVVQNEDLIAEIFDQAQEAVFAAIGVRKSLNYGAKTLVVVSSLPPHREGMDYANGGIVIENMVLAATDLGIDSCIMGAPIAALAGNAELSKAVGIPDGFTPVLGVVFGYATEDAPAKEHMITVNRV